MRTTVIDWDASVIDSRDVIELRDYLRDLQESGEELTADDVEDLARATAICDQAEPYAPDWDYGVPLIAVSHWVNYVRELVQELGFLPSDMPAWISRSINWESVAREVSIDYTLITVDGMEWWVR